MMALPVDRIVVPSIIHGKEYFSSSTFDVISAYTNKPCWSASSATSKDAIRAVESAQEAFPTWSTTKPTARRDILLKAAVILESRLEENAKIMRTEMGADVGSSLHFVAPLAVAMLKDIAGRITSICGSVPVVEGEGQSAIIFKEPMGVILGIVPWNAPYVFGVRAAACALATGNTTVLKSSELSPRCYWAIAKAFLDAGLPVGCFNVISCRPEDAPLVVNTMIEHPAVKKINFTGSTAVGRKIAKECGQNLKPCLMELGGKNSAIICADADLKVAVPCVLNGFSLNSGQICMSTDRIIVHSSISQAFIRALHTALKAKNAPTSESFTVPTLVNATSKARVESALSSAVSLGAHLLQPNPIIFTGPDPNPGVRFMPTLIDNATEAMPIWNEEAFAPLAACMTVSSDEEAIAVANRGGYGLSASVFTENLRNGLSIAKKLESGAVHINSMTVHDEPVLPHGGVKNSGWGRFNASEGLEEFLVRKVVTWKD